MKRLLTAVVINFSLFEFAQNYQPFGQNLSQRFFDADTTINDDYFFYDDNTSFYGDTTVFYPISKTYTNTRLYELLGGFGEVHQD